MKMTNGKIWKWNPDAKRGGSAHIHFWLNGPFLSNRGQRYNKPWTQPPYEHITIFYNFLKEIIPLWRPCWIFGQGRADINFWAGRVDKRVKMSRIKELYKTGRWEHIYANGVTIQKNLEDHGHYGSMSRTCSDGITRQPPYLALQWNAKPNKCITLEMRLNEQHPTLTAGILNGLHLLAKTRIPIMRSIKFRTEDCRELSTVLNDSWEYYTHKSYDRENSCRIRDPAAAYRSLDIKYQFEYANNIPPLEMDLRRMKSTSWESPLDFYKESCLFATTNRMNTSIHAGKIFVLMANGLIAQNTPSYLLWDIPRLFNYVFKEKIGSSWFYKGGLLNDEQIKKYGEKWVSDKIKTEDDANYSRL